MEAAAGFEEDDGSSGSREKMEELVVGSMGDSRSMSDAQDEVELSGMAEE